MTETNYQLYSDINLIKGYNRTLLFDGLRNQVHFIPNEYSTPIIENECNKISETNPILPFLLENELAFESHLDFNGAFPKITESWDTPYKINVVVIELSVLNFDKRVLWTNNPFIGQINFVFSDYSMDLDIENLIISLGEVLCDSIEFTFENGLTTEWINNFLQQTKHLQRQIILNQIPQECLGNVSYEKGFVNSDKEEKSNLNFSFDPFFESFSFNVFFNHKMFIDSSGYIKRDRKDDMTFGFIKDLDEFDQLMIIFELREFRKFWTLTKEKTEICQECEFRRNCVDKRIPKINSDRIFHDSECSYNPFISKWRGEENYLSLSDCGVISDNGKFSIDYDKIAEINKNLWEDE